MENTIEKPNYTGNKPSGNGSDNAYIGGGAEKEERVGADGSVKTTPEDLIKVADNAMIDMLRAGKYADILSGIANLGNYSLRNIMLILTQKPKATNVAGMRVWNFNKRSVKQGEKSIKIVAPTFESGNNGNSGDEKSSGYKLSYVFDVSQTAGKDLQLTRCTPEILDEYYEGIKTRIANLATCYGYTFTVGGDKNKLDYGNKQITLREGMSRDDVLKTMISAVAAVNIQGKDRSAGNEISKGRAMFAEIEGTAVTNIVSNRMGLGDYKLKTVNFSDCGDEALAKFGTNLNHIRSLSQRIINTVESYIGDMQALEATNATTESDESGEPGEGSNGNPFLAPEYTRAAPVLAKSEVVL